MESRKLPWKDEAGEVNCRGCGRGVIGQVEEAGGELLAVAKRIGDVAGEYSPFL